MLRDKGEADQVVPHTKDAVIDLSITRTRYLVDGVKLIGKHLCILRRLEFDRPKKSTLNMARWRRTPPDCLNWR
jgi:hypothetical protein